MTEHKEPEGTPEEVEATEAAEEPAAAEVDPAQEEIARLGATLSDTQARLRAVSKAYTDLQGEMHAFRERMEARARGQQEQRAFQVVKAFFDPVQNLRRSLSAGGDVESLHEGLRMVQKQFDQAFENLGLEETPGVGAPFDPNYHEALAAMPVGDASQDGRVLMVHITGYMVNGKALQAGQVVVGKYTPPEPPPAEAPAEAEAEVAPEEPEGEA